jgi:hypothetical protein
MEQNDQIHYLLFSGGFDSTAALLMLLSQGKTVVPISFTSKTAMPPEQSAHEKACRANILNYLRNRRGFRYSIKEAHEVEFEITLLGDRDYGCSQSAVWPLAFMAVTPLHNAVLCAGYRRTDDFWHNRADWECAVTAYYNLSRIGLRGAAVRFEYPVEWMDDRELIDWYASAPELFDLVSFFIPDTVGSPQDALNKLAKFTALKELWAQRVPTPDSTVIL